MRSGVPQKLAVIGDSGVFGWGDPEEGGWCERLRRHWMPLPAGPVVYNLGVRGDGLERVAARLTAEVGVRGELRRQVPQGILLAVGLNDTARIGRPDGRPQLAPEAFLFGLRQLLSQAQALAPVFVLGLTPVLEDTMPWAEVLWYGLADVQRYEGLLEEACMEANVPFLPVLHPTGRAGWRMTACTATARVIVFSLSGCAAGRPCWRGRVWSCRSCPPPRPVDPPPIGGA